MAVPLLLLALLGAVSAKELDFLHSLDAGKTWKVAGSVEGSIQKGQMFVSRAALDEQSRAQLKALIEADKLYSIRVGDAITSVRASCWASGDATESLSVAMNAGQVVGLNYKVLSQSCSAPAASAAATASIPQKTLEAPVVGPVFGAALFFDKSGKGGSQSQGASAGFTSSGASSSSQSAGGQKQVGQAGQEGEGQQPQQAAAEQTWFQKNWMFVLGGAMVGLNIMSGLARVQQPAGQGGQGAAAGAAARR